MKRTTLQELARLPDADIDVALGAALIARDAYPDLDVAALLARFDDLAAPLAGRGLGAAPVETQAEAIAERLFDELGFRGNEQDYYDPRNSLLPDVLERRVGIPITLALVYCELARRVGVRARGVSFPGHFLVRVDAVGAGDDDPLLVDPFHGGRLLDRSTLPAEHLGPASARATLVRMLTNLKGVHLARGDLSRAHLALDRIVSLVPTSHEPYRERALLAEKLGAVASARADLERFLVLAPPGPGADDARAHLARLRPPAALN